MAPFLFFRCSPRILGGTRSFLRLPTFTDKAEGSLYSPITVVLPLSTLIILRVSIKVNLENALEIIRILGAN